MLPASDDPSLIDIGVAAIEQLRPERENPQGDVTMSHAEVKPVPEGMRSVTPHLVCAGAADAIEFYKKAFGAVEVTRLAGE